MKTCENNSILAGFFLYSVLGEKLLFNLIGIVNIQLPNFNLVSTKADACLYYQS